MTARKLDLLVPPSYCQYADGACDQDFAGLNQTQTFFLYSSKPEQIAFTIEAAADKLGRSGDLAVTTWKDLPIAGKVIFCEICKGMRRSVTVVADVTTLNFNLLFEIGYAIGLGLPVLPIRDTTYAVDKRNFEELGLLDTMGYLDFSNSDELTSRLSGALPGRSLDPMSEHEFRDRPIYLVKGPIDTEGAIQTMSAVKKSGIHFRTYDPIETPRLSLHEARRQVVGSTGVITNLLDPNRSNSLVHNARSAFICGLAMAQEKAVAILQEGQAVQPIDYRDVVKPYVNPNNVSGLLQPALRRSLEALQDGPNRGARAPLDLLRTIDLGDVAAENEIRGLREYFVATGQSTQAKQGHARLVVGRKGAGKTAVFYDVRSWIGRGHDRLVLDLKPEGHQFTKLRELVLDRLSAGLQEHTMVAFWNYILLGELARKALDTDRAIAHRDPRRYADYQRLNEVYLRHDPGGDFDFSQRLLMQVDRISRKLGDMPIERIGGALTQVIYSGDFRELGEATAEYLRLKDSVWLLVDNLDKGWPVRGTTPADILIVRSLLDATRKLQHQLENNDIEFECLVFLRSDIYDHLVEETPDKGKDTAVRLDWEDPALFEEILRRRVEASTQIDGPFREVWPRVVTPLIAGEDSFQYVLRRTLMRPRNLLQFVQGAIHVAINRGHSRVEEDDLIQAEHGYSQDLLLTTSFEIADTHPEYADLLYAFEGVPVTMSFSDATWRVREATKCDESKAKEIIDLLVWFSVLGVLQNDSAERYLHDVGGNLRQLMYPVAMGDLDLVIHPAFRAALSVAA